MAGPGSRVRGSQGGAGARHGVKKKIAAAYRRFGIPGEQHLIRQLWLDAAGVTEGAIFRRIFNKQAQRVTDRRLAPRNVAAIVKQGAARLGFDPSTVVRLS